MRWRIFALVLAMMLTACGGGGGGGSGTSSVPPPDPNTPTSKPPDPNTIFASLDPTLDAFDSDSFVFILGDASGRLYTYRKGGATDTEVKLVASYSKWLASAMIMSLVQEGVLSLEAHPQDYISWWTSDSADPRARMTLGQLLDFTSGFSVTEEENSCVHDISITLEQCAMELYQIGVTSEPGTVFNYGPAHLQIAAYIAEVATGQSIAELFRLLVAQPLSLTDTSVPSGTANPYMSGGFHSTVADTERFLRALMTGQFLASLRDQWDADRTGPPVTLGNVPGGLEYGNLAWRYALGHWRECAQTTWDDSCENNVIVSSPGALGWYPWIDYANGYYAVVAAQAGVGDIRALPGVASIELGYTLRPLIEEGLKELH